MIDITNYEFVYANFLEPKVEIERRDDGTLLLRSPVAPAPYARCLGEFLERWAREKPAQTFLAQRESENWRTINFHQTLTRVRAIASALLKYDLSASRPLAILSENSIEHALIALAAMHVGIPYVPISASYSLMSKDFKKLKTIFSLMNPGLVFAEDGKRFAPAISALNEFEFELITLQNAEEISRPSRSFSSLSAEENSEAVDRAYAEIHGETIIKFLLTSGSTGEPKAVINTQRMICSNQEAHTQTWKFLTEEPPVLVDWLPWNHTMAGNLIFATALVHGGSYYIDDGRPMPGLIEKTVRNLREISPTTYFNVPRGYEALLPFLENDAELRRNFFKRLKVMLFGGAALPQNLWERLNRVAIAELGRRVHLTAGYGATETAPGVTLIHFPTKRTGGLGLPIPGVELKLIPVSDKYELRVRGENVTPGYWKREDLTAAAFDEEGFYKMGDAARFVDADDPTQGIEFAGRVAEEFKLTSGTWVHVGALRVKAIAALAPVAQDIVITGHDRDEIGFLIFPSIAGCRSLCPDLNEEISLPELLSDVRILDAVKTGMQELKKQGGGSSTYATRAIFLEEFPSIDAGEITDKGYLNQRAVLERRAEFVEKIYGTNKEIIYISL